MKPLAEKWIPPEGGYRVFVEARPWKTMAQACANAESVETGGILIGYYSQDRSTAIVTHATCAPSDSESGPTGFHRGVVGLRQLLSRLWENSDRRYYLGEWHYHPANTVEPSCKDFIQMRLICVSTNYHCAEPILLIVGKGIGVDFQAKVFVFPKGAHGLNLRAEPSKFTERFLSRSVEHPELALLR